MEKKEKKETKICTNCKRELLFTYQFFPLETDGIRLQSKCRECSEKDGKFLELPKSNKRRKWTKEEDELLVKLYAHYTNKELIEKFFPDRSIRSIGTRADVKNCTGKTEETLIRSEKERATNASLTMTGRAMSEEQKKKLSEIKKEFYRINGTDFLKGREFTKETRQKMSEAKKRINKWKGEDNPRHQHPLRGKENGRWKGGYKPLINSMREEIKEWKKYSANSCNYKSVLTGQEFSDIHHLIPFRYIFDLGLSELNLEERACQSLYEPKEYEALRLKIIELHEIYGLIGMCLEREIHKLFHDTYGYTNNTPEQFLTFVEDCEKGVYNDFFAENNMKININKEVINAGFEKYRVLKEVAAA